MRSLNPLQIVVQQKENGAQFKFAPGLHTIRACHVKIALSFPLAVTMQQTLQCPRLVCTTRRRESAPICHTLCCAAPLPTCAGHGGTEGRRRPDGAPHHAPASRQLAAALGCGGGQGLLRWLAPARHMPPPRHQAVQGPCAAVAFHVRCVYVLVCVG